MNLELFFDQSPFNVRCEWGLHGVEMLAQSDVIVIVDVLSFTTSVDVAVSRGATVFPYRWKDETAIRYAAEHSADVAGTRDRFSEGYSLAPSSLIEAPEGLRLVLPSPNGSTLAWHARERGAIVVAGCLRNACAVAEWASRNGERISVIPAGERWPDGSLRPAVEDLIGAGAILKSLERTTSPEARVAVAAYDAVAGSLREALLDCASGRELLERGFERDVAIASELDASTTVPVLEGDAFVARS